jgi:hypothetical protein
MAKKFVIYDGTLMLGDVEFHEDLVRGADKNKVAGGGRWLKDPETQIIYFYGSSVDFGKVTREEFDKSDKQPSLLRFKIVFSEKEYMKDVLIEQQNKNNHE